MNAIFKRRNNMRFRGEYGFLSNFYNCCIEYEGKVYLSVENASKHQRHYLEMKERYLQNVLQ